MAKTDKNRQVELKVGHIYEAKRPRVATISGLLDDRQIVWMSDTKVQYDSPMVKYGQRLPIISKESFLRWVGRDVTEGYPKKGWRKYDGDN